MLQNIMRKTFQSLSFAALISVPALALAVAQPGKPAPDFSELDASGATQALSDYKGQWLVLDNCEQLDDDALFFLRARGINESEARLLLTRAVAHGIVDELEDEALRNYVGDRVDTALASLEENNRQQSARNGGGA